MTLEPGRRVAQSRFQHFAQSDRGIVMIRRMLQDQLDALAAGRDPIGLNYDPSAPPVVFEAGNYIRET